MRKYSALMVIVTLLTFIGYQQYQLSVQKTKYNTNVVSLTVQLPEPQYGDIAPKEGTRVVLRRVHEVRDNAKSVIQTVIPHNTETLTGLLDKNKKVTFKELPRNSEWQIEIEEGSTTVSLTTYVVKKEFDDTLLLFGWIFQITDN